MDGFSVANTLRRLRDRRAQQFASDSVTRSLEPSDQRCASRKQRRKCARKLRDLKFEERVSKHRQTELETVESRSSLFRAGPQKNSRGSRGHQRDDSQHNETVVYGHGDQEPRGRREIYRQSTLEP